MTWRIPVRTQDPLAVTTRSAKSTRRFSHIVMGAGSNATMILEGTSGMLKWPRMLSILVDGGIGADLVQLEWCERQSDGGLTVRFYFEDLVPNGESFEFDYATGLGGAFNHKNLVADIWQYFRPMPDVEIDENLALYLNHIDITGTIDLIYDEVSIL